jgi:hypothetical protein
MIRCSSLVHRERCGHFSNECALKMLSPAKSEEIAVLALRGAGPDSPYLATPKPSKRGKTHGNAGAHYRTSPAQAVFI